MEERRKGGRGRPQSGEFVENFPRFRRAAELQQSQSLLQTPMTQSLRVARRFCIFQNRQRLAGALLLQEIGRQIEARPDGARRTLECLPQELLGALRLAADPHEGAQVGERGGMGPIDGERLAHRSLGVLDHALGVAREPVIDPSVGPPRIELNGGGEGLLGARVIAERRPSLAVGVVRRREASARASRLRSPRPARPDCRRSQDARPRREGTGRDRLQAPPAPLRSAGAPLRAVRRPGARRRAGIGLAGRWRRARRLVLRSAIAVATSFARSASTPRRNNGN